MGAPAPREATSRSRDAARIRASLEDRRRDRAPRHATGGAASGDLGAGTARPEELVVRLWQRKPAPIDAFDDPGHVEGIALDGSTTHEETIFELELRTNGRSILWTSGGARAVIEEALRVAENRVSLWHNFPTTFEIELRRLRNMTPRYPVPPPEIRP